MSTNAFVSATARNGERRAARARRSGSGPCVAGVTAREARERRQVLAEIAAMLRRNPFLDVEL